MKKTIFAFVFLCIAIGWTSCKKAEIRVIKSNAIEFGYSNFAWGAVCKFYRWSPQHLYKSTQACDPRDTVWVYDLELPAEKEAIAQHLADQLRDEFYYETPQQYFTSGCADCGLYSITIEKDGERKTWYFDEGFSNEWPKGAQYTFDELVQAIDKLDE